MPPGSRRAAALVPTLVGMTMIASIISSLGAPLLPSVAETFDVSLDSAHWSLTAALLAAAIASPIMGRLGDGPYRRETITVGLLVVLAGSFVAGLATSLPMLIVGRAMQGVAFGLVPLTMAAARDHLPPERSPGVIALLSVAGAAGVGLGYPISGLTDELLGLHAAFLCGAVISGASLVAALLTIPSTRGSGSVRLDVRGAALGGAGLVALLLAIGQGERWEWGSTPVVALFAGAAVLLGAWARLQLATAMPLVNLRLLRHPAVLVGDLTAVFLGVTMYMYLTLVSEFVQTPESAGFGFGATALTATMCLVPFSVTSVVASRFIGRLTRRYGAIGVLVGGCLTISAAGAFLASVHGRLWEAFVAMGVVGVGFGYTFAALPGLITRSVPADETGSAMGVYQVARYVGFSIGSALTAAILTGHMAAGATHPSKQGFVTAFWIGAGFCAFAAAFSWALSRRVEGRAPAATTVAEGDAA